MRVHEVVLIVAAIFAGSSVAGGMARRDTPLKVSAVETVAAPAAAPARATVPADAGHIAALDAGVCAGSAMTRARCDAARPRAQRAVPLHHARQTDLLDPAQMALFAR